MHCTIAHSPVCCGLRRWLCGGCVKPKHDKPKGFRWDTDSITESKWVVDQQRKFATRSIKKRKEQEEDSVDKKVRAAVNAANATRTCACRAGVC